MFDDLSKWVGFAVAGLTSIIYGIKVWDDMSRPEVDENGNPKPPKTQGSLLRNAIYGAFGSGLVCLLVCDGLIYYGGMHFSLALLIGALCGFTGADAFKDILLRFVESKINQNKESK